MRHVLEHDVAGAPVVGIWDDVLERGRIVWQGGQAFDLIRPRDDTYIERIIREGGTGGEMADVLPAPVEPPREQLRLF